MVLQVRREVRYIVEQRFCPIPYLCKNMSHLASPGCYTNIAGQYSPGRSSISDIVTTHVLNDDLTVVVGIGTRVLVGPFNGKDGAGIVVQATYVVATTIVVL